MGYQEAIAAGRRDQFSSILLEPREPLPSLRDVVGHVNHAIAHDAVTSIELLDSRYAGRVDPLPQKDRDDLKDDVDNVAATSIEADLSKGINQHFGAFVVDCEGLKEHRKLKERYKDKPLLILSGYYGLEGGKIRSYIVFDPVEGTNDASKNQRGSIAVGAGVIALPGQLSRLPIIPPEDVGADYMRRLVAGRQLRGINPQMRIKEIVELAMNRMRLIDPKRVEFVALQRARNKALIEEIQDAGATFIPIDSGDVVPAFAALKPIDMLRTKPSERRVIISVGSGGKTEALIAAIAAKATGGVFFGNFEDGEGNQSLDYPGLKGENWVPYRPEECFASFAPITGIDKRWGFDMDRVDPHANGFLEYKVPVIDITSVGDKFFRTVHTFQV